LSTLVDSSEVEPRVRVALLEQAGFRVAFSVPYCAFDAGSGPGMSIGLEELPVRDSTLLTRHP